MAFVPLQLIDDNDVDAGDLVSVETFGALANNCNHFIDAMAPGSIIMIAVGLAGCPTPDPLLWQELDGSIVLNQNSPLRDNAVPDYSAAGGRYMRGYINPGTIGFFGGSNTKNYQHSHGGVTGVFNKGGDNAQEDTDYITVQSHLHGISSDLLTDHNVEPVHIIVKHYIKIA